MKTRSLLVVLALLCLGWAPVASANTLLTNGAAVTVGLPDVRFPTLFSGDIGYAIYVPPGATKLTITWLPAIPGFVVDLHVRFGVDVGYSGLGVPVQDFIGRDDGSGTVVLVITPQSSPPLQSGTYYIGFNIITPNTSGIDGFLTASVEGGSVPPQRVVAISNFDADLEGWTANTGASSIAFADRGDVTSSLDWQPSGGNPGGYVRHNEGGGLPLDALVAPRKFLGNLAALQEPRFEFDFKQVAGPPLDYAVELRIFGAGSVFSWQGSVPPAPPDQVAYPLPPSFPPGGPPENPPTVRADSRWRHFTALLDPSQWRRLDGTGLFQDMLANVERIEVITDLILFSESNALDNFALLSRGVGPPPAVLAGNTSFASGGDGWTRNYPASDIVGSTTGNADSTFRWAPFEGNPTGYIRLNNSGGSSRDAIVAPARFLGNYSNISSPQFEFDYLHASAGTPTRPLVLRLIGSQSVFTWTGPVPAKMWTHYVVPLNESALTRTSGSAALSQVLANVERIEITTDQIDGAETDALDNFWLISATSPPPVPPALSANPLALSFTAVARGPNPGPQQLGVTSIGIGPAVTFTASASSPAGWLKVSESSGSTPRTLNVSADIANLAVGNYPGRIMVIPSAGLSPQTVDVTLTITARPSTAPRISPGGAVNAASGRNQLSPGSLGTVYGTGFGPAGGVTASFLPGTSMLPSRLQSVRLLVNDTNGRFIGEAPLLYVGDSQINFQLPFETEGRSQVQLVVDNNGIWSDPLAIQVLPSAPGIFNYGPNRAVAVNQNGGVNSPENPAFRGSILTVYMTGQGPVASPLPTGSAAPTRPLVRLTRPARAWIGNVSSEILFLGLTPGSVGLLQMNLIVPEDAPSGESPLVLNVDGLNSNAPLVSVR